MMKEYFIVPKTYMEKLEAVYSRDSGSLANLVDNKALPSETTLSLINSYLKNEREIADKLSKNHQKQLPVNVNQSSKNNIYPSSSDHSIIQSNNIYPSPSTQSFIQSNNNDYLTTPHQPIISSREMDSLDQIKNESFIDNDKIKMNLNSNKIKDDLKDDSFESDGSFESTNQDANASLNENLDNDLLNISINTQSKVYLDRFISMLGSKKHSRTALIKVFNDLINENKVKIDHGGVITYIPTGTSIPGYHLINVLLRKNGSLNTYRSFLKDIRHDIPNEVIENEKYLSIYVYPENIDKKSSQRGGGYTNFLKHWIIL